MLAVVDNTRAPQTTDDLVREALRVLRTIQVDGRDGVLLGTACVMSALATRRRCPQLECLRKAAGLVEESMVRG